MEDDKCSFDDAIEMIDDYIKNLYKDSLKEIDNGKIVYFFEAGNEYSDPCSNLIYKYLLPESNKYKIIKNG